MKRLIASALLIVGTAMLLCGLGTLQSPDLSAADQPVSFDPFTAPSISPTGELERSRADELRERLLERMRAKAELMDAEELESALQELDADILQLEAEQKLADAKAALQKVVEDYPGTQAAARAEQMLHAEVYRPL